MAEAMKELLDALPRTPEILFRAPGRANLIGEHTDYNEGLVLPVATSMATYVGGSAAPTIRLRSLQEPGEVEVDPVTGRGPRRGWGAFVTGVVKALLEEGLEIRGIDAVVSSDVPLGAGLSSSAALEVAIARSITAQEIEPERLAGICQRAENDHVGMRCGIMDQMASALAIDGHALLLDCRDLSIAHVPFPRDLDILLLDSGTTRELSGTGYNERRSECERAAATLGLPSLRDATRDDLTRDLDETSKRRLRHVITENERVMTVVEALRNNDRPVLAETFEASHESLRDDFEASTPEIDALVSIAIDTPGVLASRMTGGGFGGCTINLVESGMAEVAARDVSNRYGDVTGRRARWWVTTPGPGASPERP